ncbi:SKN1, Beta-glucanase/Beta-glucan synthetase [Mycena venus]|uniref:SKN1, Beta-glucanase/Beta-glucan synthetase n=1 Tax=Mycena venus TaxID=2733690 RepID=A0A8H6ZBK7_9AGAR|nr:SKN1, Beta-glucanase/Beta-glucan synthetase [Mycena venus]
MQLIYAARSGQLFEIMDMLKKDSKLTFTEAYEKLFGSDERAGEGAKWLDGEGTALQYDGKFIHARKFKDAYLLARDNYLRIVKEEIWMGYAPPEIQEQDLDPSRLIDNPSNRSPGFCFLDNRENKCHEYRDVYANWLLSIPELRKKFTYIHKGELIWHPGPALDLLHAFDRANNELDVAAVIGAASSVRGTEYANQFLRNGMGAAIRNTQILFKNLCLIGILTKTSAHRLEAHFSPTPPPAKLAALLVQNLAIFHLFQVFLMDWLFGGVEAHRFHEYLHPRVKGNYTSANLSAKLREITEATVGSCLKITSWRKVVGTIMRKRGDALAFEVSKKFYFDTVAQHSSSIANKVYQQATGSVPGISPEHIAGVGVELDVLGWVEEEDRGSGGEVLSGSTMQSIKALIAGEIKTALPIAIQQLEGVVERQVAKWTIQSLYFPALKPVYAAHELPDISHIQPHLSQDPAMKAVLGPKWRGFSCAQQAIALEKMLARDTNIMYIGTCGSGKTFLMLCAAKVFGESRSTIVILLHSGLHLDFIRRAAEMQVTCSKWKPDDKFDSNAPIIWAAVEHLEVGKFHKFCSSLQSSGRLNRIFFDEFHRLVTDIHYRNMFYFFSTLAKHRTQIFAASATVPPVLMTDTQKLSGIQNWHVIRMSVAWKNIVLQCFEYKDEDEPLAALMEQVEQAKTIAELLHTKAFYAGLDDKSKESIFGNWHGSKEQASVSTSLLGSGTDFPCVWVVICVHPPFTFFDWQQEMDHGGRDGRTAFGITMVMKGEKVPFQDETDRLDVGKKELNVAG